ncbi:Elongator subunit elp2 [Clydaea vesicula]|uniref:Elongator complex protein 2 n=1 Tax=Clydaea vesicula TaxID=447962 RepID=A0AAD5U3V3_9FUNG|nr:Elongator subunit elp2 [Clydaea vesicula]
MKLEYLSVSCNRSTQSVDCSLDGVIAYAANTSIILYNPNDKHHKGAYHSLNKEHVAKITSVRYLRRGIEKNQRDVGLISVSADKNGTVWRKNFNDEFVKSGVLTGHTEGINCVGVARGSRIHNNFDLVVTSSSDETMKVWKLVQILDDTTKNNPKDEISCIQSIKIGKNYPLCIEMGFLPNSETPILFTAGTDTNIHLYIQKGEEFVKMLSLQGHSDWIRTLSLTTFFSQNVDDSSQHFKNGDLILASGSQDKYVRIWKISDDIENLSDLNLVQDKKNSKLADNIEDELDKTLADINKQIGDGGMKLSTKAHILDVEVNLNTEKKLYLVMLDAVLMGHDDWVHSVHWKPTNYESKEYEELALISSSADKSLMIWSPDADSNVWMNQVRVGDVGGTTLGFYNAIFGSKNWILGENYNGSLNIWKNDGEQWVPAIGISGHFGPVKDLEWDPSGKYFVSVSQDETCRLSLPWNRNGVTTWHEVARPQIHGYPMSCITFLKNFSYISGADEKVLRIFEAPRTFVGSLNNLTGIMDDTPLNERPAGASLPALGLSNKAVNPSESDISAHDQRNLASFTSSISTPNSLTEFLTEPPLESHLLQHTLWPEVNKLYGHGYELMAVACSHDGKTVVSTSRANKAEHAAVRVWSTDSWKEIHQPIVSHNLTVTNLKFSNNDKYFLSVGRDRMWTLYSKIENEWKVLHASTKSHARIIWGGAFTPDDKYFVTASRDKTLKVWSLEDLENSYFVMNFENALTAVDISSTFINDSSYLLAVGFETGLVQIFELDLINKTFKLKVENNDHALSITTIKFRPKVSFEVTKNERDKIYIATAADDWAVRLFSFFL